MIDVGAAVEPLGIASPVPMSGFAARTAPSIGEHDMLGARALAMDECVLITLDVCALEEGTCWVIAKAVHPDAPEKVIVTATHTHAGPCSTPTRLSRCTPEIEQQLVAAGAAAGRSARAARRPCVMSYSAAHGVGVASNRRHADRRVDPPVQMLRFISADSSTENVVPAGLNDARAGAQVVATLLTYPCHPVVLDGTNRTLSGDYIHPLRERIEATYPGSVAVFATGCAGDINTGHRAEASYALQSSARRTFAEAHRVGTRIAEAALDSEPQAIDANRVVAASREVTLQFDRPNAAKVAEDAARWVCERAEAAPGHAALLDIWIEWARTVPKDTEWKGRVSVQSLGSVTLVALPGEPFLAVAEEISAQLTKRTGGPCLVIGYADGCPGYFPTEGEYSYGGYEVADAHRYYGMPGPFASGSAEVLIESAVAAWPAGG